MTILGCFEASLLKSWKFLGDRIFEIRYFWHERKIKYYRQSVNSRADQNKYLAASRNEKTLTNRSVRMLERLKKSMWWKTFYLKMLGRNGRKFIQITFDFLNRKEIGRKSMISYVLFDVLNAGRSDFIWTQLKKRIVYFRLRSFSKWDPFLEIFAIWRLQINTRVFDIPEMVRWKTTVDMPVYFPSEFSISNLKNMNIPTFHT